MKSRPIGVQSILATDHNTRRDDARGGSFLLAHQQLGALALGTTPTNGQTVTFVVNGTSVVFTAVTGTPTNPGDVKAPGTALGFVTNLIVALRRPDLTTSTFIALSGPNQALIQYAGWAWPGASTNIVPFSLNKNVNGASASLTSFNITTTVTSGSWTAQTMQLYIEDGTYYINGTRYLFTGGSTPTVTGPASNPRVDVLTIDTTGTLAWTTGAENASPVAPIYPANKLAICELYNIVSETALYDNENQQTNQGYLYNDVRPTISYGPVFSAIPEDLIPDSTNTRSLGSVGSEWLNLYAQSVYSNGALVATTKFGGTGSDGALSISSGTTTINCSGAAVVVKNYTSISITGTGVLAFSNPNASGTIVILKSQGNVTLTSSATPMLGMVGMGSAGGSGSGTGGVGGAGAGGLIIECGGAWNFTTANGISIAGTNGGNQAGVGSNITGNSGAATSNPLSLVGSTMSPNTATASTAFAVNYSFGSFPDAMKYRAVAFVGSGGGQGNEQTSGAGGGGGGAAGFFLALYNILTANSGTVVTTGGTGGSATGGTTGGGGGGNPISNGTNGGASTGGTGSAGLSIVAQNTVFS